jgi:hypothetical protein
MRLMMIVPLLVSLHTGADAEGGGDDAVSCRYSIMVTLPRLSDQLLIPTLHAPRPHLIGV